MPIFDIEGMAVKELKKAEGIATKMQALLDSGKIEEWCASHPDVTEFVEEDVRIQMRSVDRYRRILIDILDGYSTVRLASDFDRWETGIKTTCERALKQNDEPEGD